jgi:lipopolysaccharide exporter
MLYANSNADVLLIGRLLGAAPLGFYSLALNMVKMPVQRLSGVVSKVAFPTFSAVQDDLPRFRTGFLKSIQFISVIIFPLLVGLMVLAPEIIEVLLGEKWLPMVLPLQILCPVGILKSVGTTRGSVLMACGRADIEFKWNLVYLVPLIAVIYFGAQYGLTGVAVGFTALYVLTFPVIQAITNAQIKLRAKEYIAALIPAGAASMLMALSVIVLRFFAYRIIELNKVIILISGVVCGALIYFIVLCILRRELMQELLGFITKKWQGSVNMNSELSHETITQVM